jgi:hypothetical protein
MEYKRNSRKESPFKAKSRVFNIVYFLDAKKTKSLKVPLPVLRIVLACFVMCLCWTVGSVFLVDHLMDRIHELDNRLVESNAAIFDYQVKFDGVYDIAYPKGDLDLYSLVSGQPGVADFEDQDDVYDADAAMTQAEQVAQQKKGSLSAKPVAHKIDRNENDALKSAIEPEDPKIFPSLKIGRAKIKHGNNFTVLSILIKNSAKGKVAGKVWAVATLKEQESEKYFVSPEPVGVDNTGLAMTPSKSKRFALKNFSSKKFKFRIPKKDREKLDHVKVGLLSKNGAYRTVKIPLAK